MQTVRSLVQPFSRKISSGSTPTSTPSATLSILTHQPQSIAPAGVFFEAEVTGIGGEAPNHELRFKWRFGEVADNPLDLPRNAAIWGNTLSEAYGPTASHVFTRPGTYTVTCEVTDGSRTLTGTTEIAIADPDEIYTGSATWVVAADGDFTGAPAGAVQYTDLGAALTAYRTKSAPTRLLLKRGESYPIAAQYEVRSWGGRNNYTVGTWGSGANPVIDSSGSAYDTFVRGNCSDIQFIDIDFLGAFDPTTETGTSQEIFLLTYDGNLTFQGCNFRNFGIAINFQHTTGALSMLGCSMQGWQGYGILAQNSQYVGLTGCRIEQDPAGLGGGPKDGSGHCVHGPLRFGSPSADGFNVVDQCQFFSRNGWSYAVGRIAHQACIRWNVSGIEGARINVQRIVAEGGWTVIDSFGNTSTSPELPGEVIFEKSLLIGTANSHGAFRLGHSGFTARNNVMIFPNVPTETNFGPSAAFKWDVDSSTAENDAGAFRIYSNTVIDLRDDSNTLGATVAVETPPAAFTGVEAANNLVFHPNVTGGDTGAAPLDDTVLFQALYPGLHDFENTPLDAAYASPADFIALYQPLLGSAADGAAGGLVALDDFFGALRGASAATGATQPRPSPFTAAQATLDDQSHVTVTGTVEAGAVALGSLETVTAAGLTLEGTYWAHSVLREELPGSSYRARLLSPTMMPSARNRGLHQVWPFEAASNTQAQFLAGSAWSGEHLERFDVVKMDDILALPWDIYVLAGQSNMAAGATTSLGLDAEQDGWSDPRLLQWPGSSQESSYGTVIDTVHAAHAPLQMSSLTRGLSPGLAFGQSIVGRKPERCVVLVCAAWPATTLEGAGGAWNPDGTDPYAYAHAVARTNACRAAAPAGSAVRAVLWGQGEADVTADMSSYPTAFAAMRTAFGAATGAAGAPWIILGPLPDGTNTHQAEFLRVQAAMDMDSGGPEAQPDCIYVARDAGHVEADGTHSDAEGQRIAGRRAAEQAILRLGF
ncbi:sialate O-acetylesterase [Tropicimonas sediminicola]|uniref:PKD domain-containing protein n=1 Tax=Tropicimonas sediminicola TaxID=1031541 RepID=A0A239HAA1_9RHOB|nr:sialate O-acetylesterase [Tropicimonas sediminicola]SNS78081.1 hypothetical protein SAMN05421757_103310 [Tropicimonas sediminicola]